MKTFPWMSMLAVLFFRIIVPAFLFLNYQEAIYVFLKKPLFQATLGDLCYIIFWAGFTWVIYSDWGLTKDHG